jgi:thiosulfate/3-mercaptopyruvate sulfurtransferase
MNMKKWILIGSLTLAMTVMMTGCANETGAAEAPAVEEEATVVESAEEIQSQRQDLFMSVESLQEQLEGEAIIIVDARGQEAYDGGHIPSSIPVAWQQLSTMSVDFATPTWGSVVDADALAETIGKLGIDGSKPVVVYADTEKGWGEDARVLWTLHMAGIDNVKILDGGINLWNDKEGEITTDTTVINEVAFSIESLDMSKSIDTKTLADNLLDYKVIDTRDYDEYEGAVKFGEARGGHIPGAIHLAYKSLLNDDGSLKSDEELVKIFDAAGLKKEDKIATYCTAGIRSAHVAVILNMLGYEHAVNYDESFYVWANTPDLKLGRVVKEASYNYYTQEDLKAALEAKENLSLVDIQVAEDFSKHHIAGAIETNAFPVKTDDERMKLDSVIETIKTSKEPVVIVCPRGGGGAQRTVAYMMESGIPSAQLYILEKGQEGWPFEALLAQ